MQNKLFKLVTPLEAEQLLGKKYFYRQKIYRLIERKKIPIFRFRDQNTNLASHIVAATLQDLEIKLMDKFPELAQHNLRVFYDTVNEKRIVIDGLFGKGISLNTDEESEDDLILKITHILEWIKSESDHNFNEPITVNSVEEAITVGENVDIEIQTEETNFPEIHNTSVLPEEIFYKRIQSQEVLNIIVKSQILVSLPSIAVFLGIRTDLMSEWIEKTTFVSKILSIHHKQIHATEISGAWKKGIVNGYTPFIPFEMLPELIVSFRQSGRAIEYPEKAQLLYEMSTTTLEAVGLAISGDSSQAASELAKVGRSLGIDVAEQVIAIFKQYESRDFQIQTNKEFNSKVKSIGADFSYTTGTLTLGITGRYPNHWKLLGASKQLPAKLRETGREVMRQLSPENGVGMTFGEKHYIKDPNLDEAIETGRQGKEFYNRLKKVGLLDEN